MKKLIYIFFILMLFILSEICFGQVVTKVLITGGTGDHDLYVENAFKAGYASYDGTQFMGISTIDNLEIYTGFEYAKTNGYQLIIRSILGIQNVDDVASSYPDILVVMPAGSNSPVYVYGRVVSDISRVVSTGAGITGNNTGYQIEFYGPDVITSDNLSSFSNGYIAGQLAFIANKLSITLQQARILARQGRVCDFYNGYGSVDVGTIVTTALPVELTSFSAELNNSNIVLSWQTATEVNNYGFEIQCSADSKTWTKIGFVQGHGNSNSPRDYSFTNQSIGGDKFYFRLKQIDNDGKFQYSKIIELEIGLPIQFALSQNYPNPFNPSTMINYSLPVNAHITLKVYDMLGREVVVLVNEEQSMGTHQIKFDGSNFSSGTYVYKITTGNFIQIKKMILVK